MHMIQISLVNLILLPLKPIWFFFFFFFLIIRDCSKNLIDNAALIRNHKKKLIITTAIVQKIAICQLSLKRDHNFFAFFLENKEIITWFHTIKQQILKGHFPYHIL